MWWQALIGGLPEEVLVLAVLGLGLALMFGLVTGQAVLQTLGVLLLLPVIPLFVGVILGELPGWVSLLLTVAAGVSMLRFVGDLSRVAA